MSPVASVREQVMQDPHRRPFAFATRPEGDCSPSKPPDSHPADPRNTTYKIAIRIRFLPYLPCVLLKSSLIRVGEHRTMDSINSFEHSPGERLTPNSDASKTPDP